MNGQGNPIVQVTRWKAVAGAVTAAVVAGLGTLYLALDDGAITAQEAVAVAISALTAGGVTGGVVERVPRVRYRDAAARIREQQKVARMNGGPDNGRRR